MVEGYEATVLIVDDEEAIRTGLAAALKRARFRVLEAADGNQAMAIIETQQPDVVVLDILMPGGGYLLSPGHPSLQMDVPPENIVAMFDEGRTYGRYV